MLNINDLPYLETVPTEATHKTLGAATIVWVEISGEALGDLTIIDVDLAAQVIEHEQGTVAVGTGTFDATAQDSIEASIAAQLEAGALAKLSKKHSGYYSIDTGSDAYAAGFVVAVGID